MNEEKKVKLSFKLQYYFNKYKDTCIIRIARFKQEFKKQNGEFALINELIKQIQDYQIEKYGELVTSGENTARFVPRKNYYSDLEKARNQARYGTKNERSKRRIDFESKGE